MFPPTELTAAGLPVLITDQLEAPADFLLHRIVTSHLKERKENRCILLSISNDLPRWKAVSAKSGVNLDQRIKAGSLKFVDLVPYLQPPKFSMDSIETPLPPLFNLVGKYVDEVSDRESQTLVVFDHTSSLEWLGHSTIDSTRFIRAIFSLCRTSYSSLLIRHHVLNREEPDDLLRQLLQIVPYHIEVRPLSSGRSGAVSGEVAFHSGPTLRKGSILMIPRNQVIQYRLTDYGAVFFEKGTGGSVL